MKHFLLLVFSLAIIVTANATIYYVDYTLGNDANSGTSKGAPLKRFPGMATWSGSIIGAPGDSFIAKGGESWPGACFPWVIPTSGSAGNVITYGVDATWYTGGAWSKPTFDGNHGGVAAFPTGMIRAVGKSYLVFDNLRVINCGTTMIQNGCALFDFLDCHHLTFSRPTIIAECERAFYIHFDSTGTFSTFTISNFDVSRAASLVWFASSVTATKDGLSIIGGKLYDGYTQIGNDGNIANDGTHSDGLLHSFGAGPVTNLLVANNWVTGDFRRGFGNRGAVTSFCYFEGGASGMIYGNIFAPLYTHANFSESFISGAINSGETLEIYNNVIWANAVDGGGNPINPASGGLYVGLASGGTLRFKNNIIRGFINSFNFIAGFSGTLDSDYNTITSIGGEFYANGYKTYSAWQALGYDTHSTLGTDATFVSAPSNMRLASGSNGIASGTNLSAKFTTGIASDSNPPNPALVTRTLWDRGPYVYGVNSGGGDTTAPTPNPSTISSATATGATTAIVLANTATDASSPPVQYAVSTDNGSTWSAWQSSATFNIIGLAPATTYQCKVKARDSATTPNETTATTTATSLTTSSPGSTMRANPKTRALTGGF